MTEAAHVLDANAYLERERQSETKHEFVHGVVVAMAGGTAKHNAIAGNLIIALGVRLRGKCLVFPSDQRVHVEATGLFTYPDITVVCGTPRFHPNGRDTLQTLRELQHEIRPLVLRQGQGIHEQGLAVASCSR